MKNLKAKLLKARSKKAHCPYCPNGGRCVRAIDTPRIKSLTRKNSSGGFCGPLRWFPETHTKRK